MTTPTQVFASTGQSQEWRDWRTARDAGVAPADREDLYRRACQVDLRALEAADDGRAYFRSAIRLVKARLASV